MVTLTYIDLGLSSAQEFWTQVVLPDFEEYESQPCGRHAIHAAGSAWHLLEWVFREQQPAGTNEDLGQFRKDVINKDCPELGFLRDLAEAVKHRGLRPPGKVKEVSPDKTVEHRSTTPTDIGGVSFGVKGRSPGTIFLDDGTTRQLADVLRAVYGSLAETVSEQTVKLRPRPSR
jgi:hypothetical protein